MRRFWRLAQDSERMPEMLAGLHVLAFACILLTRAVAIVSRGSRHGLGATSVRWGARRGADAEW
jgi:hypothetical protein